MSSAVVSSAAAAAASLASAAAAAASFRQVLAGLEPELVSGTDSAAFCR